jgi:hypothetical protein
VLFVFKGGNSFSGVFDETDVPAFVKEYFAAKQ